MADFIDDRSGKPLSYTHIHLHPYSVVRLERRMTAFRRFISLFMLDPKKKLKLIEKHRTHAKDTGSPQVQIAILTLEVKELTAHLKTHKKDHSSRRGLIKKVNERRRLLKYLEREDAKACEALKEELGLK